MYKCIYLGLESSKQHHEDGGSTGIGSILWPLTMMISMVGQYFIFEKHLTGCYEKKRYSPPNSNWLVNAEKNNF